jgi:hypothetical protein
MSTPIVGVLPMGGAGSRLGFPFHKALAPTILPDGRIVPLYTHALERLQRVTPDIRLLLSPEWRGDRCLAAIRGRRHWPPRLGLAHALGWVARKSPGTILAIAFPDSVWLPEDGFVRMFARLKSHDGVLGLFQGSSLVLDPIEYDTDWRIRDITRHSDPPAPDEKVVGWGCALIRSEALADFDDSPLQSQLMQLDLVGSLLIGPYRDLGTPERYVRYHNDLGV